MQYYTIVKTQLNISLALNNYSLDVFLHIHICIVVQLQPQ